MADQLSNNDPNLKLAKEIGLARDQGKSLAGLDDPLIQDLLEYKEQKYRQFDVDSIEKQTVWNSIESATKSTTETPVTKLFSSTSVRWAAAAVLLIGAIFSFVYWQFYQQPTLLAESGSAIKKVRLIDGSNATLRPNTKLYSLDTDASTQRYKLQGEGYFEVTPNTDRTFSVETQTGRVSVLGTRFTLSTWGEQMQVYLEEGTIKVEALEQDSAVVLSPGESASVNNKNAVPAVTAGHAREFMDWLNQQLIFEDRPAEQIVNELEQQFNISINLPAAISSSTLTGQLSLANLQTSLQDLELALGGEFNQTGERTYTFEAN